MSGTRTQNTMSEGLVSMLQNLAALKAAPDANLDDLSTIEANLLQVIKRPQQEAVQAFAAAGGVVPGAAGGMPGGMMGGETPGGLPMGGPPPPTPFGGGGAPQGAPASDYKPWGVQNGRSAMPPVDELRRLVASSSLA